MQHFLSPQRLMLAVVALLATATPAFAFGSEAFWFPKTVTPYGHMVNDIYQLSMWICVGIMVVVEVGLVYALWAFRKRPNDTREPATWHHNTKLEVIWTIIPFVLLIVILVPTFKALAYFADVPSNPQLTLQVVGHQFFWEYRYPELGISMHTSPRVGQGGNEELYIPTDTKMKVVITSADVIHSWWVPEFGFQQFATPGNLSIVPLEVSKPGLYTGQCAYLCGALHGAMNIIVRAVPRPEFDAWAAKQSKAPFDTIAKVGKVGMVAPPPAVINAQNQVATGTVDPKALAAAGQPIFAAKCAGCHGGAGAGMPGMFPPLAGSEIVNGPDDKFVHIVKDGLTGPVTVKGGSYNGMMPPWKDQLSAKEISEVMTYVRTSWGNNGKPITPAQVQSTQ
ncbi:MAG TPA: cytochrome c oxidase subunit II [Oscillatoriaceae cyanobacterium]